MVKCISVVCKQLNFNWRTVQDFVFNKDICRANMNVYDYY